MRTDIPNRGGNSRSDIGRLADICGRKKIFTSGIILFTLSSLLCAASFSTPRLLFFRTLQGIGNAMVFATGMAILVSVYPPQERGKYQII